MPERVLKFLRDSGGEAAGPKISGALGMTRTAVWKKIARLRAGGYRISASKSGYRLLDGPDLSIFELKSRLPGVPVIFRENVSSTNDLALQAAFTGTRPPAAEMGVKTGSLSTLVVAGSQTAGRGRLGRQWFSPPGVNIYMSVVFRPEIPPRKSPLLALAAGLASALAIKGQTGLQVRLKWPNDLVVPMKADGGYKKIGGILLEFRSDPDKVLLAVAGIGINANMEKKTLPKGSSISSIASAATSILAETGRRVDRGALAAAVYKELDYWTKNLLKKAGGEEQVLQGYQNLCVTIGGKVRIQTEGSTFTGTAAGINGDGRLILRTEAGRGKSKMLFSTGEVRSVRGDE